MEEEVDTTEVVEGEVVVVVVDITLQAIRESRMLSRLRICSVNICCLTSLKFL